MALLPVQRPLNIVDFPQHSSLSAVSVPIICPSPLCVMCSASFPCRELLFTPKTLGKNYSITRSFPSPFSLSITFSFVPTGLLCLCWLAPITVLRLLGYKMWPPARQGLHPGHCCVLNSCVGPQTQKGLKKYFSDLISELEFFFFFKEDGLLFPLPRYNSKRWTIQFSNISSGIACHTCNKQGKWKWTSDKL